MRRNLGTAAALASVVALATCSEGPTAGELEIHLSTARTDARAVQFLVTAAESRMIEDVTAACGSCTLFTVSVNDGEVRGVVTGSVSAGPLVRVLVSDVGAASAYGARVVEAATDDFALLPAADFQLEVRGP